jgi:hypothetical protein
MNQWLPSSGRQWIAQAVVFALLLGVGWQYATASATARRIQIELDSTLVRLALADEAVEDERALSDLLISQQDSAQAADTAAVNAVAVVSDATASETARALAEAREAAAGLPVVQAALDRADEALEASEEARLEERSTSAAALFESQMRERTLGRQLLSERQVTDDKDVEQDRALSLAMEEADFWERAAKPGMLTQVWKQGRWVILAVGAVLVLK